MMLVIKRGYLGVAAAAVLVGGIGYAMTRPPVYAVDTGEVTRGPVEVTVDEDARTVLRHHTEVAAPLTGTLAEGIVRQGDSVSRGAVVAVMYPAPLDPRQREEASAALSSASWLTRQAESRVAQARTNLDQATRDRDRADRLFGAAAISVRDHERAIDAARNAQSDMDAALAASKAAAQEEQRARTALIGADPGVQTSAGKVVVRAPMSGRVLRVMQEHDRVVAAGTPILSIGDASSVELEIPVLTSDALRIHQGDEILARSGGGSPLRARVTRIEAGAFTKVSPLGVEEQRVNVIGNFMGALPTFGDEFAVPASIIVARADDVIRVPVSALISGTKGWSVFVVKGKRVSLRRVDIGRRGTADAEVKSGLRVGDTVVLYPESGIEDGARVTRR